MTLGGFSLPKQYLWRVCVVFSSIGENRRGRQFYCSELGRLPR